MPQNYAKHQLRPLISPMFDRITFSDKVLTKIFIIWRLITIFPLRMYSLNRDIDSQLQFMEQIRPLVMAAREIFDASTLKMSVTLPAKSPGSVHVAGMKPHDWILSDRLRIVMPLG